MIGVTFLHDPLTWMQLSGVLLVIASLNAVQLDGKKIGPSELSGFRRL